MVDIECIARKARRRSGLGVSYPSHFNTGADLRVRYVFVDIKVGAKWISVAHKQFIVGDHHNHNLYTPRHHNLTILGRNRPVDVTRSMPPPPFIDGGVELAGRYCD